MNSAVERIDLDPGQVVLDHRARVYRYLLSMARDPDVAEDLTQETFLRALRGLGALRDSAALVAWLDRVAMVRIQDLPHKTPGQSR
jgi:RNA polymerase sigma-70 factor, ECF subfamily